MLKQPTFLAAIEITQENFQDVREKILSSQFLEAASAEDFIKKYSHLSFERLDHAPELVSGNSARLYLWAHKKNKENPRGMIAAYGSIERDGENITITPSNLIRGDLANFILFYQMSCCTGLSALICMTSQGKDIYTMRDSMKGTQAGQTQIFKGKVQTARDHALLAEIQHIALHVQKKPHTCSGHKPFNPKPDLS